MTNTDLNAIIELTDRHNQQITQRISDLTQSTDKRFEQIAGSIDKMSEAVVSFSESTTRIEEKALNLSDEVKALNTTQKEQGRDIRELGETVAANKIGMKIAGIIGTAFIVAIVGVAVTVVFAKSAEPTKIEKINDKSNPSSTNP